MSNYTCITCSFSTKKKFDYERHKKTNKHIMSTQKSQNTTRQKNEQNVNNNINNECKSNILKCKMCDLSFSHKSSLNRHMKRRCKKNININPVQNDKTSTNNDTSDSKLDKLEAKLNKLMSELVEAKTVNRFRKNEKKTKKKRKKTK